MQPPISVLPLERRGSDPLSAATFEPPVAVDVLLRPAPVAGATDLAAVQAAFSQVAAGEAATVLVGRCTPTAAFSRRDALSPGIERAWSAAETYGFTPVTRHVGGHLAAYDEHSMVVHVWAPAHNPAAALQRRFAVLSEALKRAVGLLGVPDVRVGPVPGEYCDGAWSVNAGGVAKLAGTGQRIGRRGWMWSAVLTVARPQPVRDVLARCYPELGLPFRPETVGAVSDHVPNVAWRDAVEAVLGALEPAVREVLASDNAMA